MLCNYPDRKQMVGDLKISDSIKQVSKSMLDEKSLEAGEELVRKELCTIAVQHGMYRPYETRVYRFRIE